MPNPMTASVCMLTCLTMMVGMMFRTILPMVLAHRPVAVPRGDQRFGPDDLCAGRGVVAAAWHVLCRFAA